MEKLRELLNEFEIEKATRDYTRRIEKQNKIWICGTQHTGAYIDDEEAERIIISKKYGFIDWLLKKNKIDRDELYKEMNGVVYYNYYDGEIIEEYSDSDGLIMLLSIQDEPIKFLIKHIEIKGNDYYI